VTAIARIVLSRITSDASMHRDTGREVPSQLARYELTCARYELAGVRSDRALNGLLRRELRELLRYQVMILSELLQQVVPRRHSGIELLWVWL
jgi:hypothetical protein